MLNEKKTEVQVVKSLKKKPVEQQSFVPLAIEKLSRCRYQPRRIFREKDITELADSIAEHGVLQPILVWPVGQGEYEIIAGERRWRASQKAGLSHIPAIIREDLTDEDVAVLCCIENLQREDLNPIEEAQGLQNLIDLFAYEHKDLAKKISKSRSFVSNSLRLLKLDAHVQGYIGDGELEAGHGKVLAALPGAQQRKLAKQAVKNQWSVRKLEATLKKPVDNKPGRRDPNLARLEQRLSDVVGSDVTVDTDSGKLIIDYTGNHDVLNGILQRLGYKPDS